MSVHGFFLNFAYFTHEDGLGDISSFPSFPAVTCSVSASPEHASVFSALPGPSVVHAHASVYGIKRCPRFSTSDPEVDSGVCSHLEHCFLVPLVIGMFATGHGDFWKNSIIFYVKVSSETQFSASVHLDVARMPGV